MVKRAQSIDGFISRPNRTVNTTKPAAKLDAKPTDSVVNRQSNNQTKAPTRVINNFDNNLEQQLLNDIEDSLSQINSITPAEEIDRVNQTRRRRSRGAMEQNKKTRPKKTATKKIIKRVIIVLILVLLIGIGYFAVKAYLAGGKIFKGNPLDILTTKTRLAEDSNGRTNVLIFGTSGYSMDEAAWDGAMLTDSIMVVSIDQDENNAYMVSLPRDLYVKHTCKVLGTTAGKLNETFYCGYADAGKNEAAGAKALMQQTGEILGLDVHYYVHADWTALIQLVDAVGGVDVDIYTDDPRGIRDSNTGLNLPPGVNHINGQQALALARARNHNYGDYGLTSGNYAREQNQQRILAALQQKALSLGTILNPVSINNMIDALGNNLITDFQAAHVQTLIDIAKNVSGDKIKSLPLVNRDDGGPNLVGGYSSGGSYLGEAPLTGINAFDYSEIQKYMAKHLTNNPVVQEGATVDILNGSEQTGLASDVADELKKQNYTIGSITNAPELVTGKAVIYQRNTNMPGTAKALKDRYGVDITQGELDGYTTTADFIVVLGADYGNEE